MENETEKLIRLLIVDEGLHKAEQITSALRAAGVQVRAEFAEDSDDMSAMLEAKPLDLILFSIDLPEFSLKQASHLVGECGRHVALIAMTQNPTPEIVINSIKQGAQDVVSSKSFDHLILVTKREASSLAMWRKAMRLELELQESENRCQTLLTSSNDAVAYVHEGMHIYANAAYMKLFGKTDIEELEGTPIIDMVEPGQQDKLKSFLRSLSKNDNDSNELELKLHKDSGETLEVKLEFSRASYDSEPCTQILIRTVADTSGLVEQIDYLHQHDQITGLFNRQNFMGKLNSSLTLAMNGAHQSAVVYLAIDNFQSIRDQIGISGSDILIGEIAKTLKKSVPQEQILARFGTSSYTCLGISKDKSRIEKFAADFVASTEEHVFEIGDQSISITCSASVCFIDQNSPDNANEIILRAEKTCDEVQAAGGNSSSTFIPKLGEMTVQEEVGVAADLIKDALTNNRITGIYQPVVSIKAIGGERYFSGLELLEEDGNKINHIINQVYPDKTGTAKALDRWTILHAMKKVAESSKKSRSIEIFIPLSVDSVLDTSLPVWVSESLVKFNISGEHLIFMIDEDSAVNHLKAAKALYEDLKKNKCQFALDNFGTGLNPFQLIKHIKADYIRVNTTYMEDLSQNAENQESIRELATQAASMKIHSITPAVDDAAILSVLWSLGVDFVQGGFLQEPNKSLNYDFSSMTG
jgi:diguanylate cyclase (GGDEF)-like protein/PAS domain S-box-containing protein